MKPEPILWISLPMGVGWKCVMNRIVGEQAVVLQDGSQTCHQVRRRPVIRRSGWGLVVDGRRLRCFGHTLNLVFKTLLFGPDVAALEAEYSQEELQDHDKSESQRWRVRGAVGKLHNIVKKGLGCCGKDIVSIS